MDGTTNLPEVRVGSPIVDDYAYLCRRMRPDEIDQWKALTGLNDYSPDLCARALIQASKLAFVAVDRHNMPIAIAGFDQLRPGVWEAWAIGTVSGWDLHWRAITKECRRMMDNLINQGAHRIQICAIPDRTSAHAWYERGLQMTREATLRGYFADGQDGIMFAKVKP